MITMFPVCVPSLPLLPQLADNAHHTCIASMFEDNTEQVTRRRTRVLGTVFLTTCISIRWLVESRSCDDCCYPETC